MYRDVPAVNCLASEFYQLSHLAPAGFAATPLAGVKRTFIDSESSNEPALHPGKRGGGDIPSKNIAGQHSTLIRGNLPLPFIMRHHCSQVERCGMLLVARHEAARFLLRAFAT